MAAFGSPNFSVLIGATVAALGLISGAAVLRGGVGYLQPLLDAPSPVLIVAFGVVLAIAAVIVAGHLGGIPAMVIAIPVLGMARIVVESIYRGLQPVQLGSDQR